MAMAKDKLIEGKSDATRSKNIATEIKAGKPPAQAAAIAYREQREAKDQAPASGPYSRLDAALSKFA